MAFVHLFLFSLSPVYCLSVGAQLTFSKRPMRLRGESPRAFHDEFLARRWVSPKSIATLLMKANATKKISPNVVGKQQGGICFSFEKKTSEKIPIKTFGWI